jgi:hypothetical protein
MVWTRHRPQTDWPQVLTDMASKELGLSRPGDQFGMRVAYMEALGEGRTFAEMRTPALERKSSPLPWRGAGT